MAHREVHVLPSPRVFRDLHGVGHCFPGGRTHTEEYICNDCHSYICAYPVFHMLMQHCVAILMSAS